MSGRVLVGSLSHVSGEGGIVVGRKTSDLRFEQGRGHGGWEIPPLVFRAMEGLVEGGGWQAKPPTCILSEGGDGGCESPPSLESRVGGWWLVALIALKCCYLCS